MTTTLSPTESLVFGVPALVLGVALLLFGYRIFRVLIAIVGAFVGFGVGAQLPGPPLVMGILGALVGLVLVLAFYRVGVFLIGALVGFLLLGALTGGAAPPFGAPAWALPLAAALVGGLVALWLERPAIVAATAFDGAYLAWHGGFALAGEPTPAPLASLLAVLAITLAGAAIQWRVTARPDA